MTDRPSCSLGGVVGVLGKMSVKISPTSCMLALSDCGKIKCRCSNVCGPSPLPYLSRFDYSVWFCWRPGMWVIEGMWMYNCMSTFISHLPPGLTMPRHSGDGAPGIIHTGSCLLNFCFDPPSPVVLRLLLSNDRCPPSCWMGSRDRSCPYM